MAPPPPIPSPRLQSVSDLLEGLLVVFILFSFLLFILLLLLFLFTSGFRVGLSLGPLITLVTPADGSWIQDSGVSGVAIPYDLLQPFVRQQVWHVR